MISRTIALAMLPLLLHSMRVNGQSASIDAKAQAVFGIVSDSSGPLTAAFVEAKDAQGRRVIARLTDKSGRFRLDLARDATYQIHVERVGYADTVATVDTQQERVQFLRLMLRPQALTLAPIHAQAKAKCKGVTAETGQLWSEISKVLRLAEWADQSGAIEREYLVWTRTFKSSDQSVTSYHPETVARTNRPPFKTRSPSDLVRFGFVRSLPDTTYYLAPDAGTILSAEFLTTHCYSVNTDHQFDSLRVVGLNFKPLPSTKLPDVRGTLWVSVDSLQLKHLEYEYTNLPGNAEFDPGTGRLEFQKLDGGQWIVSRWWIRLPIYAMSAAVFTGGPRYKLVSFHEDGGEVRATQMARGNASGWGETGSLSGVMYDSIRGQPLAGVVLMLEGTPWKSAPTDSTGHFSIASIPAGAYSLKPLGSTLDSIPPEMRPVLRVSISTRMESRVQLAIPGYKSFRRKVCKRQDDGSVDEETFIIGTMDDATATKGAMLQILANRWAPDGRAKNALIERTTWKTSGAVGADGWFRICDVPIGVDLKLSLPGYTPVTARAARQSLNFVRLTPSKPDAGPRQ